MPPKEFGGRPREENLVTTASRVSSVIGSQVEKTKRAVGGILSRWGEKNWLRRRGRTAVAERAIDQETEAVAEEVKAEAISLREEKVKRNAAAILSGCDFELSGAETDLLTINLRAKDLTSSQKQEAQLAREQSAFFLQAEAVSTVNRRELTPASPGKAAESIVDLPTAYSQDLVGESLTAARIELMGQRKAARWSLLAEWKAKVAGASQRSQLESQQKAALASFDKKTEALRLLFIRARRLNNELRYEGARAKIKQEIFVETGRKATRPEIDSRLADKKMICDALGLAEREDLSEADKERIISRAYDFWQVMVDEVVHEALEKEDRLPADLEKKVFLKSGGGIRASFKRKLFPQIRDELIQELTKKGFDPVGILRSSRRTRRAKERLARERRQPMLDRVTSLNQRLGLENVNLVARVAGHFRKNTAGLGVKERIALEARRARVALDNFYRSNGPYKLYCATHLAMVLGGVGSQGALVAEDILASNPQLVDLFNRSAGQALGALSRIIQEKVDELEVVRERLAEKAEDVWSLLKKSDPSVSSESLEEIFAIDDQTEERLAPEEALEPVQEEPEVPGEPAVSFKEMRRRAIERAEKAAESRSRAQPELDFKLPEGKTIEDIPTVLLGLEDPTREGEEGGEERYKPSPQEIAERKAHFSILESCRIGGLIDGLEIARREVDIPDQIAVVGYSGKLGSTPVFEAIGGRPVEEFHFSADTVIPIVRIVEIEEAVRFRGAGRDNVETFTERWGVTFDPRQPDKELFFPMERFDPFSLRRGEINFSEMAQPPVSLVGSTDPETGKLIVGAGAATGVWYENKQITVEAGLKFMDGQVIQPGEITTVSDLIGPISLERGFKEGKILDGQGNVIDGVPGGGACALAHVHQGATLEWSVLLPEAELDRMIARWNETSRAHSRESYFATEDGNRAMQAGLRVGVGADVAFWQDPGGENNLDFHAQLPPQWGAVEIRTRFIPRDESPFGERDDVAIMELLADDPTGQIEADLAKVVRFGPFVSGEAGNRVFVNFWFNRETGVGIKATSDWSEPKNAKLSFEKVTIDPDRLPQIGERPVEAAPRAQPLPKIPQ